MADSAYAQVFKDYLTDFKRPDFLDNDVKWMYEVIETDTKEKFDALMVKLLHDSTLNILEFYKLLNRLAKDISVYHSNEDIVSVMPHVHKAMKYVIDYWGVEKLKNI